jgi:hypothetical protein
MRVLLLLCLVWGQAWGATWYVRPIAGEYGTEDGTSLANAFDGFGDMAGSYASIAAGDTVCYATDTQGAGFVVADAQSNPTHLHFFNDSGSAGNPITLDGDCDGDGVKTTIDAGGTIERVMQIADNNNLTIKNLDIRNGTRRGMLLYNVATDATDRGALIVDSVYVGNIEGGATPIGIDVRGLGVTVRNSTIEDIGEDGIFHKGPNSVITGNTLRRVSTEGTNGDCIQLSDAYLNFVMTGNYCDHTNVASKQCFIASVPTDAGYGVMSDNTCLRPAAEGTSATYGIYVETASGNSTILRNYYKGGRTAIQYLGAGTADIRGNVSIVLDSDAPTAARCISLGATSGQTDVENNSCSGGYDGIVSDSATVAVIRNNAVANVTNDCIDKKAGDTESYNKCAAYGGDLVSNDGTTTTPGTSTAAAVMGWVGGTAPTTSAGFKLASGSALRRAGADGNIGNIQDSGNRAFLHPPSIGAWEAASGDAAAARTAR